MVRLAAFVLSAIVVGTFVAPVGFGAALSPGLHLGPDLSLMLNTTKVSSNNWAGYATTSGAGLMQKAQATWVQPSATCSSKTSYAAIWVGIDGYGSSTVEQVGTLIECTGGTASYYSWWEMYPSTAHIVGSVSPGDHISASVTYNSTHSNFKLVFKDVTAGTGFTQTAKLSTASESSAECIVEAAGGASTASGFYPLTDFGSVKFTSCIVRLSVSNSFGIGSSGAAAQITMVSYPSGSHVLAKPSKITGHGAVFTVTWYHST